MAKWKQWSEMSRKEKITGVSGLFIVLLILASILSGGSKPKTDSATNTNKTSGVISIDSQQPPPVTPQPVTPKVYTGNGDDVVAIEKPTDGAAILTFECPNCADNTSVKTNGYESLLVNTVGAYSGSHIIDVHTGSITTQATITASSSWTLTISGLDKATQVSSQEVSGQGDAALYVSGNTTKAAFTNIGDSNFAVNIYPADGGYADLPINTIGSYRGTVSLQAPAYVQITSSGNWSIAPS